MERIWTAFALALTSAAMGIAYSSAWDEPIVSPESPLEAEVPAEPVLKQHGPVGGLVVSGPGNTGSFFFAESPSDCHYTFTMPNGEATMDYLIHDKLELTGSDRTGRYWQYRVINLGESLGGHHLPKTWYFPKDDRNQPAIWYQTDDPTTKAVLFGKPSNRPTLGRNLVPRAKTRVLDTNPLPAQD